jgi:peptidoglycan/LPS O-acetylase OafA/YrhL
LIVFGLWHTKKPFIIGPLSFPPVVYLGKISYGLYVIHMFVMYYHFPRFVPAVAHLPSLAGSLAVTVALAAVSWHCIESPINNLKHRFPYGKPRTPKGPGHLG